MADWTSGFIGPDRLARLLYPETLATLALMAVALTVLSVLVRVRATAAFDLKVSRYLQLTSTKFLNSFAGWMTFMGNGSTLITLAIVAFVICALNRYWMAGSFVLASLLALPLNVLLKKFFDRERPGAPLVNVLPGSRWGTSYPSGHAMCSTAFYGFTAFLTVLHATHPVGRYFLNVPLATLPPLVALSRVYVGAHWFSDVVGGMAAGMILVVALAAMYPV